MESMVRRDDRAATWPTWLLTAVAMLALVVAASSDTVRIWTNPEPSTGEPPAAVDRDDEPPRSTPEPAEGGDHPWIGTVLQIMAAVLFAAIVIGGVVAAGHARPTLRRWRRWSPERHRPDFDDPLPEAADRTVRVDAAAARASLSGGAPRNAIVQCWMRLEADVRDAGLPRASAETSSEFVERVIARSSVDPRPINELAALYREARFSVHELSDEHRDRAARALERVVAALDSPHGVDA